MAIVSTLTLHLWCQVRVSYIHAKRARTFFTHPFDHAAVVLKDRRTGHETFGTCDPVAFVPVEFPPARVRSVGVVSSVLGQPSWTLEVYQTDQCAFDAVQITRELLLRWGTGASTGSGCNSPLMAACAASAFCRGGVDIARQATAYRRHTYRDTIKRTRLFTHRPPDCHVDAIGHRPAPASSTSVTLSTLRSVADPAFRRMFDHHLHLCRDIRRKLRREDWFSECLLRDGRRTNPKKRTHSF